MATPTKVDLLFSMVTGHGWTETYYTNTPDGQRLVGEGVLLARSRSEMLGKGCSIKEVRASSLLIKGDSDIQVDGLGGNKEVQQDDLWADIAHTVAYVRVNAGDKYRCTRPIGGFPDGYNLIDADANAGLPAKLNLIKKFEKHLKDNAWCLRVLSKEVGDAPEVKVANVRKEPTLGQYEIAAPGHGLAVNDKLRISGVRGKNVEQVNGVQEVAAVTGETFIIRKLANDDAMLYEGGGVLRKRVYRLEPITSVKFLRDGHRIRSARSPFDREVGRR